MPCDLKDTQKIAQELCLIEVQADLIEQLHKAAKGSIRLITVGLSRIEAFARIQKWDSINAMQWSGLPFFFPASGLSRRLERDRIILAHCTTMNIERQTSINQELVGVFLCKQLPSEISAWVTIEERVVEPGYWGQFDWDDEHIQALLDPYGEWLTALPIHLASLGFEGVEAVEWRTINEHNSSTESTP